MKTIELSDETYNQFINFKEKIKDNPESNVTDDEAIDYMIELSEWALIYK